MEADDPRHGTLNGYINLDCRCVYCKRANAIAAREFRWMRRIRLLADPTLAVHGSASTYTNWGCRCRPCTDARNEDTRERRERNQAKLLAE